MSFKIASLVESLHNNEFFSLKGPEKAVLLHLANRANKNAGSFPSHQYIADCISFSRRTVIRCLRTLCDLGIITIRHRFKAGRQISNYYTIMVDKLNSIISFRKRKLSSKMTYKPVHNSVDNPVNKGKPLMVGGGDRQRNESSTHDTYINNNYIKTKPQKMVIAELLQLGVFKGEVVNLIRRHGLEKICFVKQKIEELIRIGKIIVKNFGAYLRKALEKFEKELIEPLKISIEEKFRPTQYPTYAEGKRQSPQEFKELSAMLNGLLGSK